jgi:hypothetical protein
LSVAFVAGAVVAAIPVIIYCCNLISGCSRTNIPFTVPVIGNLKLMTKYHILFWWCRIEPPEKLNAADASCCDIIPLEDRKCFDRYFSKFR